MKQQIDQAANWQAYHADKTAKDIRAWYVQDRLAAAAEAAPAAACCGEALRVARALVRGETIESASRGLCLPGDHTEGQGCTGNLLIEASTSGELTRATVAGCYHARAYCTVQCSAKGVEIEGETVSGHQYRVSARATHVWVDIPPDGSRTFRPEALCDALLAGARIVGKEARTLARQERNRRKREVIAACRRLGEFNLTVARRFGVEERCRRILWGRAGYGTPWGLRLS